MKRRLRRLIVFAGVLGLVMAMNVGAAFAHDNNRFGADTEPGDVTAPVGSNALQNDPHPDPFPGQFRGFGLNGGSSGNAVTAIANNPNCPAHWVDHP